MSRLVSYQARRVLKPMESLVVRGVKTELARCCLRGFDGLDDYGHNETPVWAPKLESLASIYREARNIEVRGRIAQIRTLLQESFAAYAEAGNRADSVVLIRLFFEPSGPRAPRTVLDKFKEESGFKKTEDRNFERYWYKVRRRYAKFLAIFVMNAMHEMLVRPLPVN